MTSLGFENYAEALKIYLSKYREVSPQRTAYGRPGAPFDLGYSFSKHGILELIIFLDPVCAR